MRGPSARATSFAEYYESRHNRAYESRYCAKGVDNKCKLSLNRLDSPWRHEKRIERHLHCQAVPIFGIEVKLFMSREL